jgi:predicted phosphoribosyltransferase
MKYINREQAGFLLANKLKQLMLPKDSIVLALPRGGIPVAFPIAHLNHWDLDVLVVRKIGAPLHPEYAIGAISSNEVILLNQAELNYMNIQKTELNQLIAKERLELQRREQLYRKGKSFPRLLNKTVIVVDDGIATGYTIKAGIKAIKLQKPASIIVAVPVASYESVQELENLVDKVVCPLVPAQFCAVGEWYDDFTQTSDAEVIKLLSKKQ